MPLTLRLTGHKQSSMGTCTFLAPPKQMQIILEGVTYLQTLDPIYFLSLTAEHRYIFWYCPKMRDFECANVFGVTDNFMCWGKEGVVVCFVQCVLAFNLWHLKRSQVKNRKMSAEVRCDIQKQVFEFVKRHSFPPELVKQYQEYAEDSVRRVSELTPNS
jgi:hypothetical protein